MMPMKKRILRPCTGLDGVRKLGAEDGNGERGSASRRTAPSRYHGSVHESSSPVQREPSAVRWWRKTLDSGADVRALTRDPDRAALPREVEMFRGDLTAPETMDVSVRRVDALFLLVAAADAFRPHSTVSRGRPVAW